MNSTRGWPRRTCAAFSSRRSSLVLGSLSTSIPMGWRYLSVRRGVPADGVIILRHAEKRESTTLNAEAAEAAKNINGLFLCGLCGLGVDRRWPGIGPGESVRCLEQSR